MTESVRSIYLNEHLPMFQPNRLSVVSQQLEVVGRLFEAKLNEHGYSAQATHAEDANKEPSNRTFAHKNPLRGPGPALTLSSSRLAVQLPFTYVESWNESWTNHQPCSLRRNFTDPISPFRNPWAL